jgi:2-dehydropantoate 2-reductase
MATTRATGLSIVGAGSLGQTYAGLLAANGQAVTLLATPRTAERLLAAGVIRLRGAVREDVPVAPAPAPAGVVGLTADPADLPRGAGLIFTTKAPQLGEAIRSVRAVWPAVGDDVSWVAGVQNSIAKDELLVEGFGSERVVGAMTVIGAERESSGEVTVTARGPTFLGEFAAETSERVTSAAEMLNAAGMPTQAIPDIRNAIWSKVSINTGVFGVSALTRTSAQVMLGNADLNRTFLAILREARAVSAAYGVEFGDYGSAASRTLVDLPEEQALSLLETIAGRLNEAAKGIPRYVSMTQDLLAGRPMEVEGIFGDMVERAERAGVEVPRLTLVRDLLRGLNAGRDQGERRESTDRTAVAATVG